MPTYVAFLRGINVGGHNRLAMDDLRELLVSLGYDDVRTYIQSGNAAFEADEAAEDALRAAVHDAIEDAFGYDLEVMLRTRDALADVVAGLPFEGPAGEDVRRYVTFLHEPPTAEQVEALLAAAHDAETFVARGREVYSELDKAALGDGRFTDAGAALGLPATRRTWAVVEAVLDLAG